MDDHPSHTHDLFGAIADPKTAEATVQLIAAVVRQVLREDGKDTADMPVIQKRKNLPPVKPFTARMQLDTIDYFTAYSEDHRLSMRDVFIRAADALKEVTSQNADRNSETPLQGDRP